MNNIEQNPKVADFLSKYPHGTRATYANYIIKYFKFIDKDPDEYIVDLRRIIDRNAFLDYQDKYERDIKAFVRYLKKRDVAPKTIATAMAGIKSLFTDFYIDLPSKVWKDVKQIKNGNYRVTEEHIPTHKELEEILLLTPTFPIPNCSNVKE